MSVHVAENNSFGVDVVCGELAYSNALFGMIEVEVIGDLSTISIFGLSVFERIGEVSVLFGVSWL